MFWDGLRNFTHHKREIFVYTTMNCYRSVTFSVSRHQFGALLDCSAPVGTRSEKEISCMSEETYFNNAQVTVTKARVMIRGKTYAMANVTSVDTGVIPADRRLGGWIAVVGLVIAVALVNSNDGWAFLGMMIFLLARHWLFVPNRATQCGLVAHLESRMSSSHPTTN